MTALVGLAISIGVLGGIATWLFLTLGMGLIWAAFAAWACFFHSGGDDAALKSTIVSNVFGVIVAWVAALLILGIPLADTLSLPVWAGIAVGGTVIALVMASQVKALSSIPGSVYGYACTFAFLLQTSGALDMGALTSASLDNALIVVAGSMVVGALFGFASGKLAGMLTKK